MSNGRPSFAVLRAMEEGTDPGFSTEDELASGADTDLDSSKCVGAPRPKETEHGTVVLLTLVARPSADDAPRIWQTMHNQAMCFAEANALTPIPSLPPAHAAEATAA